MVDMALKSLMQVLIDTVAPIPRNLPQYASHYDDTMLDAPAGEHRRYKCVNID